MARNVNRTIDIYHTLSGCLEDELIDVLMYVNTLRCVCLPINITNFEARFQPDLLLKWQDATIQKKNTKITICFNMQP